MSKNKKEVDFSTQDWLFIEFLSKMKLNNVKSLFTYHKDKYGNEVTHSWCLSKKNIKSIKELLV